jgi:bacillithiol system protein YtxJ
LIKILHENGNAAQPCHNPQMRWTASDTHSGIMYNDTGIFNAGGKLMIHACQTEDDLRQLREASAQTGVLLFKHSVRCPISARAQREFQQFAADAPQVACWQVLVIEHRPLSLQIAEETGITHQSPQALLFINGQVVWHASHHAITAAALRAACAEHATAVQA